MTETEFQILRPFSPAIGKYKLPTELIKDLNNYVDQVLTYQPWQGYERSTGHL